MFRFFGIFSAVVFLFPATSQADSPVVVELFTSQGCSSCPPADRLLAELATHDYVIALALHVDYWDYLGWKDIFARPEFSDRQRKYARVWGQRTVYTPQMVVQGVNAMVGSRADEIQRQIMQFENSPIKAKVRAESVGPGIRIEITAVMADIGDANIQLVRYSAGEVVVIERGENAGKAIEYVNIVESWETVGSWSGSGDAVLEVPEAPAGKYVVIVQAVGPGEIFAAARMSH
ncbi:MAG: DUF1223 domain-containing protein [Rhodobacteraceae bacterium]|nr:DUF1223 domain-containing protein [Paracoccaceae bacterium]